MPAPAATTQRKQAKPADKARTHSHPRKTRMARRRGRLANGVESDDEIVREAGTDSDTDDYQSSAASESDSDVESDDDHHAGGSEIVTPNTTQSPPPMDLASSISSRKGAHLKEPILNGNDGPFSGTTDWAQMVAEDKADDDLPVIDFADFNNNPLPQPTSTPHPPKSRKQQKQPKKSSPPAPSTAAAAEPVKQSDPPEPIPSEAPVASTSRHSSKERRSSRPRGQTPRQAYQHRLESDPSFVPTVGEFWGHDDRLLDKDLRSLSGWWRGRWQSRGRGRGAFSMRGRRPFPPGPSPSAHGPDNAEHEADPSAGPSNSTEVPPIERTWTHDGFEEMKRREERRMPPRPDSSQQEPPHSPPQRGFAFRGRGGWFGTRGRGGFTRGGGVSSPTSSRGGPAIGHPSGRPWYAMKPEKVWTKQHENFLYLDPALKPRPGQGAGLRIKLPGKTEQVIRTPPRSQLPRSTISQRQTTAAAPAESSVTFTVRLPQRAGKQKAVEDPPAPLTEETPTAATEEAATTVAELSIEDVFKVRPSAVPSHVPLVSPALAPTTASSESHPVPPIPDSQPQPAPQTVPRPISFIPSPTLSVSRPSQPSAQQQLEQIVSPVAEVSSVISAQIEETVLRNPPSASIHAPAPQSPEVPRSQPPPLHPLQTNFSPVPPTSPPYGSPYPYGPALPPASHSTPMATLTKSRLADRLFFSRPHLPPCSRLVP
ncbi:hypothetical protein NLI96_g3142 [Meripilus lineatus]|uniref:Btz domain-containing protein n=1 Tax=Meripilus lineatus TaxID=2056292 RepID=A0AAD5V7C6_9APHY|nr:hypothetical protein NLI96_g3142 [Physisporinus lineatus]